MDNKSIGSPALVGGIILVLLLAILFAGCFFVVPPGSRGVKITLGKVSEQFLPEGFGFKAPLITQVEQVTVKQETRETEAECYSSDLQQVNIRLKILYSIPEAAVVDIYRKYAGDPFDSLVAPRILEALKEVTALSSAEQIVKTREGIKGRALESAKQKIGDVVNVQDIVIENITLSKELEAAIEAKMVQEQEASKARFTQEKARIEAETRNIQAEIEAKATITRAKAEAESILIRGEALKKNPDLIALQIVEKWNGIAPMVIGGGTGGQGATMILPIQPQPAPGPSN